MLICVVAVYNEAEMIGRAVRSAFQAGCDSVHVFDGGWDGFGSPRSTDDTWGEAVRAGAVFHGCPGGVTQAMKRTGMFHHCGAQEEDHVFSLDADETVEGTFPQLTGSHYCVMFQNGENDMPGVRIDFPHGDGGTTPFPLLRVFAYSPTLACTTGGVWHDEGKWIEPYTPSFESKLPVVPDVRLVHHAHERSAERIAEKVAFYEVEHKRRQGAA